MVGGVDGGDGGFLRAWLVSPGTGWGVSVIGRAVGEREKYIYLGWLATQGLSAQTNFQKEGGEWENDMWGVDATYQVDQRLYPSELVCSSW